MESNSGVDTTGPSPGGRQCILRGRHLVVPAPWTTSRRGAGTTLAHLCSQSLYSILWRIWSHISWDCLSLQLLHILLGFRICDDVSDFSSHVTHATRCHVAFS